MSEYNFSIEAINVNKTYNKKNRLRIEGHLPPSTDFIETRWCIKDRDTFSGRFVERDQIK